MIFNGNIIDSSAPEAARILVLEDDALNAFLIEESLRLAGHEVVGPAKTVAWALALLESGEVDAAILDLQIDDGTSLDVGRRLDDLGVPYAIATGHSSRELPVQFNHVPVLAKPFTVTKLIEIVTDTLERRSGMGRA